MLQTRLFPPRTIFTFGYFFPVVYLFVLSQQLGKAYCFRISSLFPKYRYFVRGAVVKNIYLHSYIEVVMARSWQKMRLILGLFLQILIEGRHFQNCSLSLIVPPNISIQILRI